MGRPRSKTTWHEFSDCYIATLKHGDTSISKESFDIVKDFKWFTKYSKSNDTYYVYAHDTGNKKYSLHRLVMSAVTGEIIDHINRDTLDNRLSNLRKVTKLQNNVNSKKRKNSKSKYKGVTLRPSGRWGVYIKVEENHLCLGTYDTEEEAAKVYDNKAKTAFNGYAVLNKIGEKK